MPTTPWQSYPSHMSLLRARNDFIADPRPYLDDSVRRHKRQPIERLVPILPTHSLGVRLFRPPSSKVQLVVHGRARVVLDAGHGAVGGNQQPLFGLDVEGPHLRGRLGPLWESNA